MSSANMKPGAKKGGSGLSFLVDVGPLIVFFAAYKLAGGGAAAMLEATIAFMAAMVVAVSIGHFIIGRVSPMVWLSAVLILFFGALTVYFHDQKFIQLKPTIIYALLSGALFIGLLRRKPLLRWLFGPIFPGLTEEGWLKLSRNWAIFFAALGLANEVMRATLTFDTWLTLKVWGVTALSFLFAMANLPMLMRHGLEPEGGAEAVDQVPVE